MDVKISCFANDNLAIKNQLDLLKTVPGVGEITALSFISITKGFTKIPNSKALASYCGVAPFPYQSGSSIKGKAKVNKMANKKLKALLHLGALRLIQTEGHFKEYYSRKTNEGKNKMLVINAIRNKILQRMFSVIKNNQPYQIIDY